MSASSEASEGIIRKFSSLMGIITAIVGLVASWSHFYAEQKINTVYRELQGAIIKNHTEEIIRLNENQGKIIIAVSNNAKSTDTNRDDIKELSKIMNDNRTYLARIAGKVGAQ